MHKQTISSLFFIWISFTTHLQADTYTFVFENDLFAGTDQHYTNGVRLGWLSDPLTYDNNQSSSDYTQLLYTITDAIPFMSLQPNKKHNGGFMLYQMMFTPKDITSSEPNYDDIPYAGYLVSSFFLFEYDDKSYDEYKFQLGIVGKASGAEWVQKMIHKLTNSTAPQGWDTQLEDQLTLGVVYDHGSRIWKDELWYGLSSDIIGGYGAQLSNFYTGATARGTWRIGQNYPNNFNAYYTGTIGDNGLLALQEAPSKFAWSFNLGLAIDGIAYYYITDSDPAYNIDRADFLGNMILSFSFYYKDIELSLTRQMWYSLSHGAEKNLTYGAASLIWKY